MSHRFISATYQLYIEENGQEVLKEQITEDQPLSIYTEIGMLLPSFETRLAEFVTGVDYDFVLPHAEAYGEYDPKGRATLSKKMFSPMVSLTRPMSLLAPLSPWPTRTVSAILAMSSRWTTTR